MKKGTGLLLALLPFVAAAETKTWVAVLDPEGTATSANANVAENWDPAGIPTSEDDIVLDGERSNVPMVWTVAATGDSAPTTVNSWTQKASYTSRVTVPTTRSGVFTQLVVSANAELNGGEWWRAGNIKDDKANAKVWLNVKIGGNLTTGSGFKFNQYNAGYYKQQGYSPASDKPSKGAAHAGLGGESGDGGGTAYGDYRKPISLGSGAYGSADNCGGGSIVLDVLGDVVHDGEMTADAGDGTDSCGASGGSIWITARSLGGTGTITAEGGSPGQKRSGGGGGRIAIHLTRPDLDYAALRESYTGQILNRGGYSTLNGAYARCAGGAGTVYIETPADTGVGHMRLVNGNWSIGKGTSYNQVDTPISEGETWHLATLSMATNAHIRVVGTLHMTSFADITGDGSQFCRVRLAGGAVKSDIKHDKLIANGFDIDAMSTSSLSDYHLVVPAEAKLSVAADAVFTVGSLKINGTKLAAGEYVASSLTETYPNVSGEGTIEVLGLTDGLMLIVR